MKHSVKSPYETVGTPAPFSRELASEARLRDSFGERTVFVKGKIEISTGKEERHAPDTPRRRGNFSCRALLFLPARRFGNPVLPAAPVLRLPARVLRNGLAPPKEITRIFNAGNSRLFLFWRKSSKAETMFLTFPAKACIIGRQKKKKRSAA